MTSDVVVPAAETTAVNGRVDAHSTAGFKALMLGSIGVVYGDIGTSPLYAFREAVIAASGPTGTISPLAVLGVLSLIRADHRGDAEIRADPAARRQPRPGWNAGADGAGATRGQPRRGCDCPARDHQRRVVLWRCGDYAGAVGVFGRSKSSSSSPRRSTRMWSLTVIILVVLFAVQSRGTARVAAFFGPVMCVWSAVIAIAAIYPIMKHPEVLSFCAGSAPRRLVHDPSWRDGFVTLGAVFLAVTGAEALYADLGHFGKRPIQTAWLVIVLPSLALNDPGKAPWSLPIRRGSRIASGCFRIGR